MDHAFWLTALLRRLHFRPADLSHALAVDLVLSATRNGFDADETQWNKHWAQMTRAVRAKRSFIDFSTRHDQRVNFRYSKRRVEREGRRLGNAGICTKGFLDELGRDGIAADCERSLRTSRDDQQAFGRYITEIAGMKRAVPEYLCTGFRVAQIAT